MDHRRPIFECGLLRVLRGDLQVTLQIIASDTHFFADQSTRRIDLFDGQGQRVEHLFADFLEGPRKIVKTGKNDFVGGVRLFDKRHWHAGCHCRHRSCLQKITS